jgi:hypothetical protein
LADLSHFWDFAFTVYGMAAPLLANSAGSSSWFTDYTAVEQPLQTDMARVSTRLSSVLIAELAAAEIETSASTAEILVAVFGRAVARTLGGGQLTADVHVGDSSHTVSVQCAAERGATPQEILAAVASAADGSPADVLFAYRGAVTAAGPDGGYLLALHVRPGSEGADLLQLDWWFDTRSFDECTIEELSEQFPLALIELTSG